MLALSTVSGQFVSLFNPEWTCGICGGNSSQCLCPDPRALFLGGDDDTRTQGDDGDYGPFEITAEDPTDDPHDGRNGGDGNKVNKVSHLERCLDIVMEDPTVPQFTPIVGIQAWITFSKGLTINSGCTAEDPCGNAMCDYCG